PFLLPVLIPAALGMAATIVQARRAGGPDHRLLFLAHAALMAAVLAFAAPALGVPEARFVPLAHAVLAVTGGAAVGLMVSRWRVPGAAAIAVVLVTAVYVDTGRDTLRGWATWN